MSNRILLPLIGLLLLGASPASAQGDLADASRVIFFTGGGFGGQVDYHLEVDTGFSTITSDANFDLDATPLLGLRFDAPLFDYFTVGAQFGTSFWRDDNQDNRNTLIDFDVTPRGRIPLTVGNLLLEPYVVVPVGFTLAVWNSDNIPNNWDKTNPGWNIGVLGGLSLLTRSRFGALLELGWMHHSAYDSQDNSKSRGTLDQFTMHFGAMYAL